MLKRFLGVVMVLCCFSVSFATAGPANDQLKKSIDKIIDLLRDPALQAPDMKLERRNRIFKIMEEQFDFTEMAKRSVGEYWQKISDAEQKEFEVVFSGLLEKSYITKVEKYTDEHVNFTDERPKGDRYFTVHTEIVSADRSIPVEYSLHDAGGQWLVYDVNIEGVSLVTNYRSQFGDVLRREGFRALMSKLDEKVKKLGED